MDWNIVLPIIKASLIARPVSFFFVAHLARKHQTPKGHKQKTTQPVKDWMVWVGLDGLRDLWWAEKRCLPYRAKSAVTVL